MSAQSHAGSFTPIDILNAKLCLALLDALKEADTEWRRLNLPSPMRDNITFGRDGRQTSASIKEGEELLKSRYREREAFFSRRDAMREEVRSLAPEIMRLAVRPEIAEQPSKLRNLMESWNIHAPSLPALFDEARNFLADLALKLANLEEQTPVPLEGKEEQTPAQQRLIINRSACAVTLDGNTTTIDPNALAVFEVLASQPGQVVSSKTLLETVPGCNHEKTLRNWLKLLPPHLRALVKGRPGKGRWLQLPEA